MPQRHIYTFQHLCRGDLFASPQRSSQASSLGCNSLPNSQSEPSQQEALATSQENPKDRPGPAEQSQGGRGPPEAPEQPNTIRTEARQRVSQQVFDNSISSSPSKVSQVNTAQRISKVSVEINRLEFVIICSCWRDPEHGYCGITFITIIQIKRETTAKIIILLHY